MKYPESEQPIRVGDRVKYGGTPGVIVFVVDDDSYSKGFEHFSGLKRGLGVKWDDGTLFHLDDPDEDLEPIVE